MSADFFSMAFVLSEQAGPQLLAELAGKDVEYNGNVYCDALAVVMERLRPETPLSICPNFPAFVALDRFVAQPAGLRLLDNAAHRWIGPAALSELAAVISRLEATDRSAAQAMVERGANGVTDIDAGLSALRIAVDRASTAGDGVLLVCTPC